MNTQTEKLVVSVALKAVTHIKTNDTYYILYEDVLDCTNDVVDKDIFMVVYRNKNGKVFVREQNEFWKKFIKEN